MKKQLWFAISLAAAAELSFVIGVQSHNVRGAVDGLVVGITLGAASIYFALRSARK